MLQILRYFFSAIHAAPSHQVISRLRKLGKLSAIVGVLTANLCGAWSIAWGQATPATTTTLTMTSAGSSVSTVTSGSVVTLTATVQSGATAVTTGQLSFCDASATYCTDIHLLGKAQLTSAGTATLKFRPGIGSHSYKAVFVGTNSDGSSQSSPAALSVTGKFPTTTTIAQSGIPGAYTLTATVSGIAPAVPAPTGSVSFVDTTDSNSVLGSAAVSSGTSVLSFLGSVAPVTAPTGMVIATADFNGDGIPDLAVGDAYTPTLSVLLGNGDGTFTAVTPNPAVGNSPYSIIAADFNGDGIPDLAVGNVDDNTVSILLGKGDGTFSAEPDLTLSGAPQSLVTGDFNGDGTADLAVVAGSSVYVFLGNGDGTFQAPTSGLPAGTFPQGIAAGDVNGDGHVDLVVANYAESGSVTVLLGNGDGTFQAGTTISGTGEGTASVAICDLNGDGIPDLAVTNSDAADGGVVSILLGTGNGAFQAAVPYSVSLLGAQSVTVADFNGDGIPDLAIGSGYEYLAILPGKGDGTFATPVYPGGIFSAGFLAIADFNGDGLPDIAQPTMVSSDVIILLDQQSQTVTATLDNMNPPGPGPHQVEASYPGDGQFSASTSATTSLTSLVAAPVISPAAGTIASAQSITITDATPGATIYYSAYGAIATSGFIPYTGPIPMEGNGTLNIQAYATETGYQQSQSVSATYTLNFPSAAATPVISLAPGLYPSAQTVTISDSTPGATIYYTTNGTYPYTYSTVYSGPITVSTSEIVTAVALAPGYSASGYAIAQYDIASSSTRFIYTIAGNNTPGYAGDGGPATFAELSGLQAVAVDSKGNVYIADSGNNVVRMVAAGTGIITTIAGTGVAGHTGDNGPAASAELWTPSVLAVDAAGDLFIGETGDNVVRRIDGATGTITTYAGNPTGTGSIGGPATSFSLYGISGLACDRLGNLYIAEYGDVVEVNAATQYMSEIAGYSTNAGFASLNGIAVDNGENIYVSDNGYSVVWKIVPSGAVSIFAGSRYGAFGGDGGPATSAGLDYPAGLATDSAGNVYIADDFDCAIREVNTSGIINTIAGILYDPYSIGGDGSPATNVGLYYPVAIAADAAGDIYFADQDWERVRKITAPTAPPTSAAAAPVFSLETGTYPGSQTLTMTEATPGAEIYVSLNGSLPTTAGQGYHGPIDITGTVTVQAIALAPGYLASAPVSATYTITAPPTALITTVAGNGKSGFSGVNGPAINASLGLPSAVAFDRTGDLYIADAVDNVVWMVAAGTGNTSIMAGTGTAGASGNGGPATAAELNDPTGVAVDKAGNLYIADTYNGVIRMVGAQTGVINTIAGPGVYSTLGDGGPATSAYLGFTGGMALDSAGNLYIADSSTNGIRMITATTGIISTVAGGGTAGQLGDGGPATAATLSNPEDVKLDAAGNMYISDSFNGRIREVVASTGLITTIAGNGVSGDTGDGGPAIAAQINVQEGIAVDAAGNVYLSNWLDTIRKVDAKTGIISTIAGDGYFNYGGDGGAATMAELYGPQGMALDSKGNLYFADADNFRVREVIFTASAVAPTITLTPSASSVTTTQALTVTVAVSGGSTSPTPTGSVTLSGGGYTSAATTLDNGGASISIPAGSLATGSDTLTVTYSPDIASAASYATATQSTTVTVTVPIGTAAATVTATPSATIITNNQSVTVNIAVAGSSGQATPTGTVTLASGTYSAQQTLSSGAASFDIAAGTLSSGANTLTASYAGDATYATATGTTIVTVSPVTMAISTPSPVSPGGSANATVTLTAGSNYSGTLNLKCALTSSPAGAQSLPTCALNPASVTIAAGGNGTTALTINTTAASSSALAHPLRQQLWGVGGGGAVLAVVLFFGVPSRRRRWMPMLVLLGLIVAAGAIGCGGGGSGGTGPINPTTPATTAGNYVFTVTGTDSANATITASTSVSITVQ